MQRTCPVLESTENEGSASTKLLSPVAVENDGNAASSHTATHTASKPESVSNPPASFHEHDDHEEERRKRLVLVCTIGLVVTFNFFYVALLLLKWSLHDPSTPCPTKVQVPGSEAGAFAIFAMCSNAYHITILILLYRNPKRLNVLAGLFLAYFDLGICIAGLYFGVISEFYVCLSAALSLSSYIFGHRVSRVFVAVVLAQGLLLYPCSVYLIHPVAPVVLCPLERLLANWATMACVAIISHVYESSRQATLERLREKNSELRHANEAKTRFLSAITHGIIGMANELLSAEEEQAPNACSSIKSGPRCPHCKNELSNNHEDRNEAVRIIVTCARHLLGLVNDVLDFEKIESHQLQLESVPFDVGYEADMVLSMMAFPATSNKIRIERSIEVKHRTRLGDPLRFRQVIFNLLSNAIKFTPAKGTVSLSVDDHADHLHVEVRDTGIGITAEAKGNLFKHFSQGANNIGRKYGGSGLGLAICKHLVEAMRGEIGFHSEGENKGATFWFRVPLPVATSSDAATVTATCEPNNTSMLDLPCEVPRLQKSHSDSALQSSSKEEANGESRARTPETEREPRRQACVSRKCEADRALKGLKVLLVEDNVINQKVGRRLLERIGCDVHLAENGQECIEKFEQDSYSLIFMDCQMPIVDGYQATKMIREKERAEKRPRTPIVALTASCVKSDRQLCFESGMDDWLPKPFELCALRNALIKWTQQSGSPSSER